MERRSEVRVELNEPVVVTPLGARPREPLGGMIVNMSGSGMLMKVPHPLKADTLVRIEASNMLLLGEVAHCEPHATGFRVGILIRHSLQNLKALQNLNQALLESEGQPCQEPADALVSRKEAGPPAAPIMRE